MSTTAAKGLSRLGDRAVKYARRGWYVFPLLPRRKEPFSQESICRNPACRSSHANGFKDATNNVERVAAWWTVHPEANIGLWPHPSGLIVFDIDSDEDRAAAVALGLRSEATLRVISGRVGGTGEHLYFQSPAGIVHGGKLLDGIVVRHALGYVVAPPSVHPSGNRYKWEGSLEDIKALPPLALAGIKNGDGNGSAKPASAPLPERIPSGQRNATLASLAGSMRRRNASEATILAALREQNAACDPPLDEREVEQIARSVSRYKPTAPAGDVEHPEQLTPLIICAADLANQPELLLAPDSVIPGLAWKGRVTLFASREKFGKSTTLAAGIAALSLGKPFLGEAGAFGRCLYWSADRESLADQLARLRRFGANLAAVDLVLRPPVNLEEVARHLDGHDVLVVDTLASASPDITDAFSSSQWGPLLLRYVDLARRTGCAVILVHHASKSTGKYRDSTSIGATVDAIVEMAEGADSDTRGLSTVARWPVPAKRSFRLAGTIAASWLEVIGVLRPQTDARLLTAIEETPHLSATAYVGKLGARKGDVLDSIERLAAAGAIRNIGTAKAPKWERVSVVPTVPNGSGNHSEGDGNGSHPFRGEPSRTAAAQGGPATEHGNRSEPPPAGCPECGQIDWTWLEGAWRCENCARESAA